MSLENCFLFSEELIEEMEWNESAGCAGCAGTDDDHLC